MPSVVCGRLLPNVAMTVAGAGFSLKRARSELLRRADIPGQPRRSVAAAAISALGTPSRPEVAIAQVRIDGLATHAAWCCETRSHLLHHEKKEHRARFSAFRRWWPDFPCGRPPMSQPGRAWPDGVSASPDLSATDVSRSVQTDARAGWNIRRQRRLRERNHRLQGSRNKATREECFFFRDISAACFNIGQLEQRLG